LSLAALARALAADSAASGAFLVASFGLGTIPSMMFMGWLGGRISASRRRLAELVAGAVLVAMAAQQLLRAFDAWI
jgi:sulfite exporter TauE/SafE